MERTIVFVFMAIPCMIYSAGAPATQVSSFWKIYVWHFTGSYLKPDVRFEFIDIEGIPWPSKTYGYLVKPLS